MSILKKKACGLLGPMNAFLRGPRGILFLFRRIISFIQILETP